MKSKSTRSVGRVIVIAGRGRGALVKALNSCVSPLQAMLGCTFILRPLRCSSLAWNIPRASFPSARRFHNSAVMSNVSVQLTAPNGRSYTQPIGLFINNEFVASKSGQKFASINPSYVYPFPRGRGLLRNLTGIQERGGNCIRVCCRRGRH